MTYIEYASRFIASITIPIFNFGIYIWMQPSWITLSKLSKYKIVQTTIFWLIFLPTMAKITEKLGDSIFIYGYEIIIKLPFSWFYLYFSAIFIFLAQMYYKITAPNIYNENSSYEEFDTNGRNKEHLEKYVSDFPYEQSKFLGKIIKGPSNDIKTLFWKIWYECEYEFKFHRFIISTLYFIGFFFLGFVIIENIIFVYDLFSKIYEDSSLYTFYVKFILPLL